MRLRVMFRKGHTKGILRPIIFRSSIQRARFAMRAWSVILTCAVRAKKRGFRKGEVGCKAAPSAKGPHPQRATRRAR